MQLRILCPRVDKSGCLKSLFVMGLYNDPGVIMGKKKKKRFNNNNKEVCRHTNERLAFKERLKCGVGCADSRKTRSTELTNKDDGQGEEEEEERQRESLRVGPGL